MIDLTSKVTNMLEDPTLEAIKLTQYVTVLRLMKAPTSNVIHKLISAHQNRSLAIIASFRKRLQILTITFNNTIKTNTTKTTSTNDNTTNNTNTTTNTTNKNIINNDNNNLIKNVLNNTTNITDNYLLPETRQFHQELVVGLIEACKGIQELYFITENEIQLLQQHSSSTTSSSSNHYSSPHNPISLLSTSTPPISALITSSAEEKLSSPSSLDNNNYEQQQQQQQQYFEKLQAERNQAYSSLVTLLSTILLEYKSTLFQSFQLFFTTHQYYHHQLKATYCGML